MKRLTYKDPGANTIEVSGRIRSFERYARKHQVRYHIEKSWRPIPEMDGLFQGEPGGRADGGF